MRHWRGTNSWSFVIAVAAVSAWGHLIASAEARSIGAPACTSVPWGSPENYSVSGAAHALMAVEELLKTVPAGTALEGAALRDAKAYLHEAGDHIEQIINRFALVTTPGPACWRCSPFEGAPDAYHVAKWLGSASDKVYGPAHGITGGDNGIKETIEGWGNLPPCTPEQNAAVDGRTPTIRVEATYCSKIPGTWSWFVNGDVTFREDGTLVQGPLTGRWTCSNQDRRVSIVWSHGFTDSMVLSEDGTSLTGKNNTGNTVTGRRKGWTDRAGTGAGGGLWWYVQCGGHSMRTPVGPPAGDRWIGNYQLPDGSPGWVFDLKRGGSEWAGTGYRANDPQQQRSTCQASQRPEG